MYGKMTRLPGAVLCLTSNHDWAASTTSPTEHSSIGTSVGSKGGWIQQMFADASYNIVVAIAVMHRSRCHGSLKFDSSFLLVVMVSGGCS